MSRLYVGDVPTPGTTATIDTTAECFQEPPPGSGSAPTVLPTDRDELASSSTATYVVQATGKLLHIPTSPSVKHSPPKFLDIIDKPASRHGWRFCTVPLPDHSPSPTLLTTTTTGTRWETCKVQADDLATHHSSLLNGNCVIGFDPPLTDAMHILTLRLERPPEETESAHHLELMAASTPCYNHDTPTLKFELPNVQMCEARFLVDFASQTFSMYTNVDHVLHTLSMADMMSLGIHPPYRLVCYLWDANSKITILNSFVDQQ
eukprot:TRINITY_DN62838_c0_g1_i1.p2 TRINITY_DN62838_c0_g1~~TRINITY_DN62838_c0_g1_i1.p2  ORF type:complete len:287 (-),score=35.99 TRINITY_DN62838_c0_g1_i1:1399-2184(-)